MINSFASGRISNSFINCGSRNFHVPLTSVWNSYSWQPFVPIKTQNRSHPGTSQCLGSRQSFCDYMISDISHVCFGDSYALGGRQRFQLLHNKQVICVNQFLQVGENETCTFSVEKFHTSAYIFFLVIISSRQHFRNEENLLGTLRTKR